MRLSPYTLPLALHSLGLLLFVFGLPRVLVEGGMKGHGWLIPAGSALVQATAMLWMVQRLRRAPSGSPRGRYVFFLVLQNLGLWPVVGLLIVLAAR
jgi:hypothetical protein